jgi:hypothetical protein
MCWEEKTAATTSQQYTSSPTLNVIEIPFQQLKTHQDLLSADAPLKPINDSRICAFRKNIYSDIADYQKTICVVDESKNYTEARLNCQRNGMQLYDIFDSFGSFSETELLSFASKSWPTEIGRFFFIKGRKDSTCANINNTNGAFVKGFGSCNVLQRSLCQFLQISRETFCNYQTIGLR